MTTLAEVDPKSLENKTVIFTVRGEDGKEPTKVEGVVQAASAIGVAYKKKGKSALDMLEADRIQDLEILPDKPKVIKAKKLKTVAADSVRQHLADRHGINIDWLNSVSNEEAEEYHNGIDHRKEGTVLGHYHEDPNEAGESNNSDDEEDTSLEDALADDED